LKKSLFVFPQIFIIVNCCNPQVAGNTKPELNPWALTIETNFFFSDPFFMLPVIIADKNKLHLEARYNYEDLKTFSGWAGYNFSGGEKFSYGITPMIGGLAGRINGLAAGLELDLGFEGLFLGTQSEYVFDLESSENNYFYNWADLGYAPVEWLSFGISGQRTKLVDTDAEIEHGFFAGGKINFLEITGYMYKSGSEEDRFYLLTFAGNF
jgi:hypothetical protein